MTTAPTLAALALAIGLAGNASAQTGDATSATHLVLHGLSHHFEARPNGQRWNEVNTGLGLRHDFGGDLSGQIGIYRNSMARTGAYALLDYTPLHLGPVNIGAFAGAATGYLPALCPMVGAVLRMDAGRFTPTLRLIPKVPGHNPATVALEIGVGF